MFCILLNIYTKCIKNIFIFIFTVAKREMLELWISKFIIIK